MLQANFSPLDRAALSLSYGDYLRFRQLLEERFGLNFPEKRRVDLEIGVRRAFTASTAADLNRYFEMLHDPVLGGMELERLVNHLTVGETHFFRDAGQIDALANTVLPEIIEKRRAIKTLRIWSAGCASGEEPYSIAMLLRDLLPDLDRWSITILGTDINTQNLEKAHAGIYGEWAFRETRAKQSRARFFTQHDNLYELLPEIRRAVTFRRLNLADDVYPSYETNTMFMDLILCRNVTIYFPEAVTQMVARRFYTALVDGGYLVIGHSEHSLNTYQQFQARTFPDAILYQRLLEAPGPKASPVERHSKPASQGPTSLPAHAHREGSHLPPPPMPILSSPPPAESAGAKKLNDFEQAQTWLQAGRVDQAREALLRWLAQHPGHGLACTLLGKIYANLGNWQEAHRWCQMAISLDRLNLEAYYTLALIHQHQGQFDQALEMMKKVVYIDRNDILGHFSLANLCYSRGQTVQALKSLENSRKLLEARPLDALVPRSEDITVGRLAQTVVELQQLWAKEAAKPA